MAVSIANGIWGIHDDTACILGIGKAIKNCDALTHDENVGTAGVKRSVGVDKFNIETSRRQSFADALHDGAIVIDAARRMVQLPVNAPAHPGIHGSESLVLTAKCRRFGGCDVACPVNVKHARQNDAVDRVTLSHQPAEIAAEPREVLRLTGWPLGRKPIKTGGHVGAVDPTYLTNAAVQRVQRDPQWILVVDMLGQAEHHRVLRKARGGFYNKFEIITRPDQVHGSDYRRGIAQPACDKPEGRVGRRCPAHNQVQLEIAGVAFKPLTAIVARVVDNDSQTANADGAEAIESVIDKRAPFDRHHRLADAIAVRAQPTSLAGGNDAALESGMRECLDH